MSLNVNHATKQFSKHLIKTVDSDVIVISVTVFNQLQGVNELWIEFGRGKTLKYIPIHEFVNSLGKVSSRAVSFLHAFSGCDTFSAVAGKRKLSFYNLTDVNLVSDDDFTQIERFFIILYSPTLNTENINTARQILFTQGGRSLENIPPTFNCLQKHILRSCYQATNWSNALLKQRPHLDPVVWGWKKSGKGFVSLWSDLPDASEACRELIKCGCNKKCRGRCKCRKNELSSAQNYAPVLDCLQNDINSYKNNI